MGVQIVFDGDDVGKKYTGILILYEPNTGVVHMKSHKLPFARYKDFLMYALETLEQNKPLPKKDAFDEIQETIDKYKDDGE